MVWAKVDDRLHSSAKWRATSKGGRALWATALSWCADQETDGLVPAGMLPVLDGTAADVRSLVSAGLWSKADGGWQFVNWSEYQPTRAVLSAKRARDREAREVESERGRFGNHQRWHVARDAVDPTCEWCLPDKNPNRVTRFAPESVPVPSRPDPEENKLTTNPPDPAARDGDDLGLNPTIRSVVAACAAGGVAIAPLCAADVIAFIDMRRDQRETVKIPERYYPDAIRGSWPEVEKFIYSEGLAS